MSEEQPELKIEENVLGFNPSSEWEVETLLANDIENESDVPTKDILTKSSRRM